MPPNGKAAAVDRILPEARYSAEWGSSERVLLNPDPSTGFSSLDGQEQIRTMDGGCQQNGRGCWECARRVAEESRFLPLVGMTRLRRNPRLLSPHARDEDGTLTSLLFSCCEQVGLKVVKALLAAV